MCFAIKVNGRDEVLGTELNMTESDRIDRRIAYSDECAVIGAILGLVGSVLGAELDRLDDAAFDELVFDARVAMVAATVC